MGVIRSKPCSPLVKDHVYGWEAIQYIRMLKRDIHSVESHILLSKLKHEKPDGLPAYMREDSFKLWNRYCMAELFSDFERAITSRNCAPQDVPQYAYFIVEELDVGTVYEKLNQYGLPRNISLFLDNPGEFPVVFPEENMPEWKELYLHLHTSDIEGRLPPSLEVLHLELLWPDMILPYERLLAGLGRLKVLSARCCDTIANIPNIANLLPALEAVICHCPTNDCRCYRYLSGILPSMIGILPAKGSGRSHTTWVGHIYYKDVKILESICEVSLPRHLEYHLEFLELGAERKRRQQKRQQ
uniref:Disease resistance protein RGA3 n=1 Tax=Strongyloides papillosus TaxID=174720 RepID=A0A0N5BB87_STREA